MAHPWGPVGGQTLPEKAKGHRSWARQSSSRWKAEASLELRDQRRPTVCWPLRQEDSSVSPVTRGWTPSLRKGFCQVIQLCASFPPPSSPSRVLELRIPCRFLSGDPKVRSTLQAWEQRLHLPPVQFCPYWGGGCQRKLFETVCLQATTGGILCMEARLRGR